MNLLKSCFVGTTEKIDFISIIHDVRFAIRDAPLADGLVTIIIPKNGAALLVTDQTPDQLKEGAEKFKAMDGLHTSLSLPFQKKELMLDPKRMIYLVDFSDAAKRREFYVQILGDTPPPPPQQGRRRP